MGTSRDALDADLRQALHELEVFCGQNGLQTRLTSTVRSYREQKFLWDRYQKGQATFPAAPPGHSAHEYGWAFDLLVTPYEYQDAVGQAWKNLWGGSYAGKNDPVHFELPGAAALAYQIGEQNFPIEGSNAPSVWDYIGWTLDFTSLSGLLLELGYTAASRTEAEKIARALHIDPNGRVF